MLRVRQKGQSLVEFALVLPILLLLLLGVIEAGWITWSYITVQVAAKEAARYAVTGRPIYCVGDPAGSLNPEDYCEDSTQGDPWSSEVVDITRVKAIENVALERGGNLTSNFAPASLVGISGFDASKNASDVFGVLVIGQGADNPDGLPNSGGDPGWNVKVQTYYNAKMLDPIYAVVLGDFVRLTGEVEMQNEGTDSTKPGDFSGGITYETSNCPPDCGNSVATPYLFVQDEGDDLAEPPGGKINVSIQDHVPYTTYTIWFVDPFNDYVQTETVTTDSFGSGLVELYISILAPVSLPAGTPTYQVYSTLTSDGGDAPVAFCAENNGVCFEVFSGSGGVISARNIAPWEQVDPVRWPISSSIPIYLNNHDINQNYTLQFNGSAADVASGKLLYKGSSVTEIPTDDQFGANLDGEPGYYIATGYSLGDSLTVSSGVASTTVQLTQAWIDIAFETAGTTHPAGDTISMVLREHAPKQDYTIHFDDGITAPADVTADNNGEILLYYTVPDGFHTPGNPAIPVEIYTLDRNRGTNINKIASRSIQVATPAGPYLSVQGGSTWPAGSPITIQVRQHQANTTYEVYIQQGSASSPSFSAPADVPSFTTDAAGRYDIGHIIPNTFSPGTYEIRSFNPLTPTQAIASYSIDITSAPYVTIDDGIRWPPGARIVIRLNDHAPNTPYSLWIDPNDTYSQQRQVEDVTGRTMFVTNSAGRASLTYKIPITVTRINPGYDLHSFLGLDVVADNGELEILPAELEVTNIEVASRPLEVHTPITLTVVNNSPITVTNQFFDTDIYVDPEITPTLANSLPPGRL